MGSRPDDAERGTTTPPLLAQRITWVHGLVTSLDRATGKVDTNWRVVPDPTNKLRVYIGVLLTEPLEEGSEPIVKRLVRHWAALNDVDVLSIQVWPTGIEVALLLKYLGGGECTITPWDLRGRVKGKSGIGSLQTRRRPPRPEKDDQ